MIFRGVCMYINSSCSRENERVAMHACRAESHTWNQAKAWNSNSHSPITLLLVKVLQSRFAPRDRVTQFPHLFGRYGRPQAISFGKRGLLLEQGNSLLLQVLTRLLLLEPHCLRRLPISQTTRNVIAPLTLREGSTLRHLPSDKLGRLVDLAEDGINLCVDLQQ